VNVAAHVERGARWHPDRPALRFAGQEWSYARLDAAASRCAGALAGVPVVRGDRVALALPNEPAWAVSYLAIQKLGAIAVTLNPTLTARELGEALEDSGAVAAISTGACADAIRRAAVPLRALIATAEPPTGALDWNRFVDGAPSARRAERLDPQDPAVIVYSSGTIGTPKGVTLSHGNVVSNAFAKAHHLGIRADDRLLLFVPLFHCYGQNAILNAGLTAGATIVLMDGRDVDAISAVVQREAVTMLFAVPTVFALLLGRASARELRSLRYSFSAAAPMAPEVAQRWTAEHGLVVHEGYGLTETSPFAAYNHDVAYRLGSIGTPIENVEIEVRSVDDGTPLPPGEAGELAVRGPNVMLGYWGRPEETARAVRDGWLHTGDVGYQDEDGYLHLLDRLKDMVNVAGLKVWPAEVERVLFEHAAIRDATVYGVDDPIRGEQVMADVVCRAGSPASEADVLAFCRQRLAEYKLPVAINVVDQLPRSANGKVLKRVLRERHRSAHPDAQRPQWRSLS
jgi:long-chain acyl-CoA synthetase